MELMDLELAKRLALERWRATREQRRAALAAHTAALESDTAVQVCGREGEGSGAWTLCSASGQ
jgi:hypothetical protein